MYDDDECDSVNERADIRMCRMHMAMSYIASTRDVRFDEGQSPLQPKEQTAYDAALDLVIAYFRES